MSVAEDVAQHIHGSLLDLRRRLDPDVVIEVARAIVEGATRALGDLAEDRAEAPRSPAARDPIEFDLAGSVKH